MIDWLITTKNKNKNKNNKKIPFFDYKTHNRCIKCMIVYPKDVVYCTACGRKVRTTTRLAKSERRERIKELTNKRYWERERERERERDDR